MLPLVVIPFLYAGRQPRHDPVAYSTKLDVMFMIQLLWLPDSVNVTYASWLPIPDLDSLFFTMSEIAPATPTIEDLRQQLRELIDASPHNDQIIRDVEYCRKADFLTLFGKEELIRVLRIYTDHPPVVRPLLLAEECKASLRIYFWTNDAYHLKIAVPIGSLVAYHVSLDAENLNRGALLGHFARSLLVYWQRTPLDHKVLDDSIYYYRKAVEFGPLRGNKRALHLNDLGEQLSCRYVRQRDAADYAEAESCFERALALRPAGKLAFLFRWAKLIRFKDEFENVDRAEMLRKYIDTLKVAVVSYNDDFRPTDYLISVGCVE